MNQIGSFKGVYLGYQPLHVEVAGPNRHNLSWGRRLREAGSGGSNSLTPTNHFSELADFTDLLISHLVHLWSSDEGSWQLLSSDSVEMHTVACSHP